MSGWSDCIRRMLGGKVRARYALRFVTCVALFTPALLKAEQPEIPPAQLALDALRAIEQVYAERSLATIVITKKQPIDETQYRNMWKETDNYLSPLNEAVRALDAEDPGNNAADFLDGLPDFREFVALKYITIEQTVRPYVDLSDLLWKVFDRAVAATDGRDISAALKTEGHLLRAKGKLLLVRDLVQSAIEEKSLHAILVQRLPKVAEEADHQLAEFFASTSKKQASTLRDNPALEKASQMRSDAVKRLVEGQFDLDLPQWWRVQGAAVDAIGEVERDVLEEIKRVSEQEEQKDTSFGFRQTLVVVLVLVVLNGLVYAGVLLMRRRKQQAPGAAKVEEVSAGDRGVTGEKTEEPVPPPAKPVAVAEPPVAVAEAPVAVEEAPVAVAEAPAIAEQSAPAEASDVEAPAASSGRQVVPLARYFAPILDALRGIGGSGTAQEVVEQMRRDLEVPDEEKSGALDSGDPGFANRVRRASSYLQKEGLIESSQGEVWSLTERGSETHLSAGEAQKLFVKLVKAFAEEGVAPGPRGA